MTTILGLDIGGANLKAATPDKRAASVPFPLWKHPEKLPAALAELVARFPDAGELAVTMTGELCDCFETKRDGVNAILDAAQNASRGRRVRVWSTDGVFVDVPAARANHLKVAAANWHALATLAGRYVPAGPAVLIDIGSTTTDVIPILDGVPVPKGKTDADRLEAGELIYMGVRRTPLAALFDGRGGTRVAAELFATTLDAHLHLGSIPEDHTDTDTADGRPATKAFAFDRLCRMFCGDRETIPRARVGELAEGVVGRHLCRVGESYRLAGRGLQKRLFDQSRPPTPAERPTIIASGAGEFLVTGVDRLDRKLWEGRTIVSLTDRLGPDVSACAPAYAVAVLAAE